MSVMYYILEALKLLFMLALMAIGLVIIALVCTRIVDRFTEKKYAASRGHRYARTLKRFAKRNPTNTNYPYLPLTMVTKHFGWSYEYEKYHGWNYFIWYVRDDGTTISVNSFNDGSRTTAIEDCQRLEEHFYGKGDKNT